MRSPSARYVVHAVLAMSISLPVAAHAGGDAAAGKAKSVACAACHISANSASDIPHLAGQRATYIAKQLKSFQKGERVNPFMAAIAKQLSDADVDNIAAFWNGQAAGSDTTPSPEVAALHKSHMALPQDFPKGFTLFLTANDAEKNEIRTSYVNAVGFAAAKAGKAMPDGTVIIVVHQAAKLGADKKPVVAKDGSWVADKVAFYAGMEAEAGWGKDIPDLLRNADWNYTAFSPAKTALPSPPLPSQAECLACHKPQSEMSFMFTLKELKDKAGAK